MTKSKTYHTLKSEKNDTPVTDLIVVGELNMDLIMDNVNFLPEIGKERIAEDMTITLGSSSAILASNAAALGLQVSFTGRVGDDLFGRQILDVMNKRGIDTTNILISSEKKTGLTCIYTANNDRGMITYPGSMEELTIRDIDWNQVMASRHLHMSSYYLQKGIKPDCPELFEKARSMGLTTSFDTNWDPDEVWGDEIYDVLKNVDIFLPNDTEAMLISGKDTLDEALHYLASFGCIVVATCGSRGIIAQDQHKRYSVSSVNVTPVDAVGAGDSFNAGFLSKYVKGESLDSCLTFGVVTGAYSTTKAGGTTAFQDMSRFQSFAGQALPELSISDKQT